MIVYDRSQHEVLPLGTVSVWIGEDRPAVQKVGDDEWVSIDIDLHGEGLVWHESSTDFQYPREVFLPDWEVFRSYAEQDVKSDPEPVVPVYRMEMLRALRFDFQTMTNWDDALSISIVASTEKEATEKASAITKAPRPGGRWDYKLIGVREVF